MHRLSSRSGESTGLTRRAGQKYKREYLGRSDMYRLGQVQVTLAKQREPGESF